MTAIVILGWLGIAVVAVIFGGGLIAVAVGIYCRWRGGGPENWGDD